MDKYVLQSKFYAKYMDDADIVLGYPWMESVGTININVQNTFGSYARRKIQLHCRIFLLLNRKGPRRHMKKYLQ
jgi:hypothetical protein